MTPQEVKEKIISIGTDPELQSKFDSAESLDDVNAIFAENGLSLNEDEIEMFAEGLRRATEGELGEEQLENVSGGSITLTVGAVCVIAGGALIVAGARWAWRFGKKLAQGTL